MSGVWLAALSGLIAGGALLAGSAVAWFVDIPKRVVAAIMALGAGVAISNIPEGLASTAELKRGGTSGGRVAALWSSIAVITVVAAVVGFLAFQSAPVSVVAVITTVAAGGLLAMVCNTMIPEAFAEQHAL